MKKTRMPLVTTPKDLPIAQRLLVLATGVALLLACFGAYWLTVEPGDLFHFPAYRVYNSSGADAVVSGFVGTAIAALLAVWLVCCIVFTRRGSSRAWAWGAAVFGLAAATSGAYLGGSVGFALDFHEIPASFAVGIGLFGGAIVAGLIVFPSGREIRERRERS